LTKIYIKMCEINR